MLFIIIALPEMPDAANEGAAADGVELSRLEALPSDLLGLIIARSEVDGLLSLSASSSALRAAMAHAPEVGVLRGASSATVLIRGVKMAGSRLRAVEFPGG